MRYSSYFSSITKEYGPPQLDVYQFKRFMNIVAVEGRIGMLRKIIKAYENTSTPHKFDLLLFKEQKTLTDLTGNLIPSDLYLVFSAGVFYYSVK